MKRRPGRPRLPKKEAHGNVFGIRLTTDERRAVERAAKAADKSPSAWAREALGAAASAAGLLSASK